MSHYLDSSSRNILCGVLGHVLSACFSSGLLSGSILANRPQLPFPHLRKSVDSYARSKWSSVCYPLSFVPHAESTHSSVNDSVSRNHNISSGCGWCECHNVARHVCLLLNLDVAVMFVVSSILFAVGRDDADDGCRNGERQHSDEGGVHLFSPFCLVRDYYNKYFQKVNQKITENSLPGHVCTGFYSYRRRASRKILVNFF